LALSPHTTTDDAELALTWQHLGAVTIGARLDTIVIGAKPSTMDLGVELLEFLQSGILT
jgi:hypothetical protein